MVTPSVTPDQMQTEMAQIEQRMRTLNRVLTTPYPVAQTPKEEIWALNKARLYHYIPVVPPEQRFPVPLLLIFAVMNRSAILDLRPGASFVEYMVSKGFDVYLLDWGSPGPEDRNLKFDDYALEYIPRAIRKLKRFAGTDTFSILGWCLGALISTMYASLRPNDGLENLILLTAPLDFEDKNCSGLVRWINQDLFDAERMLAAYGGMMPGELIDYGAKALKPVENYIGQYLRLWDNLDQPKVVESWHAMNTWVTDLIPMAGGFYRQLVNDIYRDNKLMKGTMALRGETVKLENVKANVLTVVAADDHIVPPAETVGVMPKFGSKDKELLEIPGGHIGMMAGSAARKRTWPQIEGWLAPRSGAQGDAGA